MMRNLNISVDINVDKQELLTILEKNRTAHIEQYEKAKEGYCQKAQAILRSSLQALESGKPVALRYNLAVPTCQKDAYDTVIEMLKSSKDDTLKISSSEFRMLVMDQWDWSEEFQSIAMSYSS